MENPQYQIDGAEYKISAFRSSKAGDDFFNKFNFAQYLFEHRYSDLINFTIDLLGKLKKFDSKAYLAIHKGTPFYWMGVAAYYCNDFSAATHYFDAALSEDFRTKNQNEIKRSPSILFALLDDSVPTQAGREVVYHLKNQIELIVNDYNLQLNQSDTMSFQDIRDNLFRITLSKSNHPWRSLYTSFISFFGEYRFQKSIMSLRDITGSYGHYYIFLFKGCLLFESLLKENVKHPVSKPTLLKILEDLEIELGLESENYKGSNVNLNHVLHLTNNYDYQIPLSIQIASCLRNTIGHNYVWKTTINEQQFEKLFYSVAFSCLHAINKLFVH